jgi:hypothetical protein
MTEPTKHELGVRIEWWVLNTSHTPSSTGRLTKFPDEDSLRRHVDHLDAAGVPILRVIRRTILDEDVTVPEACAHPGGGDVDALGRCAWHRAPTGT